jgi:hypothetical protein
MKKIILWVCVLAVAELQAQSLSQSVIASAGDYNSAGAASLSWTLGEIATETFSLGNYILTQGFQQPVEGIVITGINLDLLVYLEGPFVVPEMTTTLNAAGLLPLIQPYNVAPWYYSGSESVSSIPNSNVVDWVLVELRDAASATLASSATRLARKAGFLLKDGSVVSTDGSSVLHFNNLFNQQLFVVVWHRNHVGIMSAYGMVASGGIYSYNFSTSASIVYGGSLGYKYLGSSVWGMGAGDGHSDGIIDGQDKSVWQASAGKQGYFNGDFNLNSQVNNPDKDNFWLPNGPLSSQVPQ